jgi:hypothetical protein
MMTLKYCWFGTKTICLLETNILEIERIKERKEKNEKEKSKLETYQICAANAHVIRIVEVAGTHMRS